MQKHKINPGIYKEKLFILENPRKTNYIISTINHECHNILIPHFPMIKSFAEVTGDGEDSKQMQKKSIPLVFMFIDCKHERKYWHLN